LAWRRCCQPRQGRDGRVVQTDAYGNNDKPQLKVEGTKVYQTDAYGAKQQRFEVKQKK
jgi:hypothetical protein